MQFIILTAALGAPRKSSGLPTDAELIQCEKHYECARVNADCCGCTSDGGTARAINKKYVDEWNPALWKKEGAFKKCAETICLDAMSAHWTCLQSTLQCVDKKCELVRDEQTETGRNFLTTVNSTQGTIPWSRSDAERSRLVSLGIKISSVRAASLLRADNVGPACLPGNIDAFWKRYPWANKTTYKSNTVCLAEDCFAPLYFCVRTTSSPRLLKQAGYAPVK